MSKKLIDKDALVAKIDFILNETNYKPFTDEVLGERKVCRDWFISPCWKACSKYKRCTERQADYLDIFDPKTQSVIENPHKLSQRQRK